MDKQIIELEFEDMPDVSGIVSGWPTGRTPIKPTNTSLYASLYPPFYDAPAHKAA